MIEMIDNFVFDYENDTYKDQDGIQLNIDFDVGFYNIKFEPTPSEGCNNATEDCLFKKISAKNYEEVVLKIRDILRTEEYVEWKRKACGWKEPTIPSEDKIKDGTDIAMIKALVGRQHMAMLEHGDSSFGRKYWIVV